MAGHANIAASKQLEFICRMRFYHANGLLDCVPIVERRYLSGRPVFISKNKICQFRGCITSLGYPITHQAVVLDYDLAVSIYPHHLR